MNYPIKKIQKNKFINYGKRGMNLENDLNKSNKFYLDNDIAIIYKKPTPIRVVNVDYNRRINTVITKAYYEIPSTTDYNGIYKGKYIDFEAKETKNTSSFTLKNIHNHQIKHLINIMKHGGISFLIIRFSILNETYLFETKFLEKFLNTYDRKSIPINYIKKHGHLIKTKYNPPVDYIKIIDDILGDNYEKTDS